MRIASFLAPAFLASFVLACGSQPMSTAEAERTTQQELGTVGVTTPVIPILIDTTQVACVGTGAAKGRICDANGFCHVVQFSCFPYHCSTSTATCAVTCGSNGDCATGFQCQSGACVQAPATTCLDNVTSHNNLSKLDEDCSPYVCGQVTGLCKNRCATTNDCAGGFVCDIGQGICVNPY